MIDVLAYKWRISGVCVIIENWPRSEKVWDPTEIPVMFVPCWNIVDFTFSAEMYPHMYCWYVNIDFGYNNFSDDIKTFPQPELIKIHDTLWIRWGIVS